MEEQERSEAERPDQVTNDPGGYGSKWKKYLVIYIVVGGIVYALIYFLFLRGGY